MVAPSLAIAEPLLQEKSSNARCGLKVLTVLALLAGGTFAVLLIGVPSSQETTEVTMPSVLQSRPGFQALPSVASRLQGYKPGVASAMTRDYLPAGAADYDPSLDSADVPWATNVESLSRGGNCNFCVG
jgi:hypothetical protein